MSFTLCLLLSSLQVSVPWYYPMSTYVFYSHLCSDFNIFFINGDQNPADMFTKNLGSVKFLKYQGELGLEFLE